MPPSRSQHVAPALAIAGVFAVSRVAARLAGVTFDTSPLTRFWQIADTNLLHHHLLQTLWNLHSQPPLFNLWLGINLKLFGAFQEAVKRIDALEAVIVKMRRQKT